MFTKNDFYLLLSHCQESKANKSFAENHSQVFCNGNKQSQVSGRVLGRRERERGEGRGGGGSERDGGMEGEVQALEEFVAN